MDRKHLDQATYDLEKEERWLWERQRVLGVSRRQLLQLLATGAGAAALGGLPGAAGLARAEEPAVIKPTPPELFYNYGSNRETRFEAFHGRGYLTPNELFFVRNHTKTPLIDPGGWRLRTEGSGVRRPLDLTYDDLLKMPSQTETKFIECAGNGRSQFLEAQGRRASGTQWRFGAIGVAEWTGVPLWRVLERAGLKASAVDVMPEGLDTLRVRRPLPIGKALEEDTLLVYGMNGEPLPPDHGYPVRLLTPGWVGVCNVKWLGRIEVSEQPLYSPWNTTSYIMIGDAYPTRSVVTHHQVKSAFELPWGGQITTGPRLVTGRAWSAFGRIDRVDVSFDQGLTWTPAALEERNIPRAWVQWSVPWSPTPGTYKLQARATDSRGNVQPFSVPFNEQGYLYWAVPNHPITVV